MAERAGRVGVAPIEVRHLTASYRDASATLIDSGAALHGLVAQAGNLLGRQPPPIPLADIGEELRRDGEQLRGILEFIERTDGIAFQLKSTPSQDLAPTAAHASGWAFHSLARQIASTTSLEELISVVDQITQSDAFAADGVFTTSTVPYELRPLFATAFAIAMDHGWSSADLPMYFAAAIPTYGDPSRDTLHTLATWLASDRSYQPFETSANPFDLPRSEGMFGPVVNAFEADPVLARTFLSDFLFEYSATGSSVLHSHVQTAPRGDHLARTILAAGGGGTDVASQSSFTNDLIGSLNAAGTATSEVFWATWAVHAELALSHDVRTTAPTFGVDRVVPQVVRPHWETLWNDHIGPTVLTFLAGTGKAVTDTYTTFATPLAANATYRDDEVDNGPGNDLGGTFTTRSLAAVVAEINATSDPVQRGRESLTAALDDLAPEGPIASDEFAVIDHGRSISGASTYTVLVPGVVDLSNPSPGFDPTHTTVRDIDRVAIHSAPTASVADNQYAQMIIAGLEEIGVDPDSNLLLVGHSFGADTVLDIAADVDFTERYNLTHVVAAAYDSVPQLAAVAPGIDVLVLQNERDKAITLERFHRFMGQGDESVSINTFSHEVREFDGGLGRDLGHHPDRYIEYLNTTTDPELDRFLASVDEAGFTLAGTKVAIDVSIE